VSRHTILVTGGAGFIGSHASKALWKAGFRPVVLDDLSTGHARAVRWGPLEIGSLASPRLLRAVLLRVKPAAVMHFAASAYVGESITKPAAYYRNNVANTLNLLDVMLAQGVRHLVFSSTCASYGAPERLPIDETHPQRPINPYGHTKLVVEGILQAYDTAYGLKSVALRYFNAAGADPDGEIGEDHDPETHLIPSAIHAAQGRRGPLEVFGTDYPTPDGTAVRDYIHVADLADAHVLALRYLLDGGASTALNLGVGRGYSVQDAITTIERVTRREVAVTERPRRPGDPPELVADASRARSVLGWTPGFRELDEIVSTAWRWFRRSDHQPPSRHDTAHPGRPT
jgi:UDP-arabinose 4-epimerase